jgi:hypothetical protein
MLDDIWYSINSHIGFYTRQNFDRVPDSPGIYAWYYPLRVSSRDIDTFVREVQTVLTYDAKSENIPEGDANIDFAWTRSELRLKIIPRGTKLSDEYRRIWELYAEDEGRFQFLRQVMMKATLLMPPLYVGKTVSLSRRLREHINGTGEDNNFRMRFTRFSSRNNLPCREVSDLLFMSVRTLESEEEERDHQLEALVEEIMKRLCRPAYSLR